MGKFFLLADFQHIRDLALIASLYDKGQFKKALEVKSSEDQFIKFWDKNADREAINKELRKSGSKILSKLEKVYKKHRR